MKQELCDFSDEVYTRIRARLDGLTDDEYFWEPAPGCWTIRRRADGTWMCDFPLPRPDIEPFTTIAWRLWHLIDMYGENRAPQWLAVAPQGEAIGRDAPDTTPPSTAAAAITLLERAHDRWDAHLALATEDSLREPIGPVGGDYAEKSRIAYVHHMLDEFVHHGAEIAVLRDLWRWQHPIADPLHELVMRGDMSVLDDAAPSADLVSLAAQYGRWDLMLGLLGRGAPLPTTGRLPLQLAAGAGELEVVKRLIEHGADPSATDDEYHATPLVWAEFLNQPAVADYLKGAT
ncbi:MAG TPA: DinB family protein [Acidimicrobiia bacterium]|nr:DinB family protein [Acidimicrobiia bacterium]